MLRKFLVTAGRSLFLSLALAQLAPARDSAARMDEVIQSYVDARQFMGAVLVARGGGPAPSPGGGGSSTLAFSDDSKWIAFTTYPSRAEQQRMRRQRRSGELERLHSLHDHATVAEDDELVRDLIRVMLEKNGYTVLAARDVESADLSGVAGTPTFFVNGRRHRGAYDEATLLQLVLQSLRADEIART